MGAAQVAARVTEAAVREVEVEVRAREVVVRAREAAAMVKEAVATAWEAVATAEGVAVRGWEVAMVKEKAEVAKAEVAKAEAELEEVGMVAAAVEAAVRVEQMAARRLSTLSRAGDSRTRHRLASLPHTAGGPGTARTAAAEHGE